MSRRITTPKDATDTYTEAGDTVIGHMAEAASQYRAAAAEARRRGEALGGTFAQPAAQAPAEQPLPFIGVAQQVKDKKLRELEAASARLERDLLQGGVTASGMPLSNFPGLMAMRQEKERSLQVVADQVEQLRALEGDALRQWAFDQGYR
jgi:hypothetical protein